MNSFETYFASGTQGPDVNQAQAAEDIAANSIINAGAGTGKTRTLTLRYVWAILSTEESERPIGIDNILTITYTKIGAAQLVSRITKQLRDQEKHQTARSMGSSWVSTIHAFCTRILRQEALRAEIDPDYGLIEELASVALKNETFDELVGTILEQPDLERVELLNLAAVLRLSNIRAKVLSLYAQARSQGVSVSKVQIPNGRATCLDETATGECNSQEIFDDTSLLDSERCLPSIHALAVAFENLYEKKKHELSVLDFDDLIIKTSALFDQREVAQKYRNKFRLIMIDEFQDTNQMQLDLINKIAADNVCVVGDKKQSIYRFQGADVSVFERHAQSIVESGGRVHELFTNYRSHPKILQFVNTVFSNERLMGDSYDALRVPQTKELELMTHEQGPRIGIRGITLEHKGRKPVVAEAVWIGEEFAKLRSKGYKSSDMVILVAVRTNAPLFERELRSRGFKVQTLGGSTFFSEPFVKTARNLMDVLSNPMVDDCFMKLLYSPFGCLGDRDLYELAHYRMEHNLSSLWDAARDVVLSDSIQAAALKGVVETIISARRGVGITPVPVLLARAMSERNVDLYYLARGSEGKRQYATFQKLLRMADGIAKSDSSIKGFMDYLDALEDSGAPQTAEVWNEDESDVVRIMTIHNAKGDEYPIVAVPLGYRGKSARANSSGIHVGRVNEAQRNTNPSVALHLNKEDETTLYPDLAASEDEFASQEDKRLFYVACTRAQQHLLVSFRKDMSRGIAHSFEEALKDTCLDDDERVKHEFEQLLDYGVIDGDTVKGACVQENVSAPAPAPTANANANRTRQELEPHLVPMYTTHEEKVYQFSYSDMAAFNKCPRRFYHSFIERMGQLSKGDASSASNKGLAMHLLLEAAQGAVINGDQADSICKYYGIDEKTKNELVEAVHAFFDSKYGQLLVGARNVHKEMQFYVPVVVGEITRYLKGYIDAYCELGDGRVVVIDYKSGTAKDASRENYEDQAKCYAFVALTRGALEVEVVVVRPQYYDEDNQPQTFGYTFVQMDLPEIKGWIADTALQMDHAREMSVEKVDTRVCSDCQLPTKMCSRKEDEFDKRQILEAGRLGL